MSVVTLTADAERVFAALDTMSVATLTVDSERVFAALDEQRLRLRMNRGQVAAALGFTPPAYTAWSLGTGFTATALIRVCALIGRNPMDFVREADDVPPGPAP
jgi:hypothetical protein